MSFYYSVFTVKRLWLILAIAMIISFGVLLFMGRQIYQMGPPISENVATTTGEILFTGNDVETGQNVWQSIGGMEQGSIWGHGSYLAPDWSADWLHREAIALLVILKKQPPSGLTDAQFEAVQKATLITAMRESTYEQAISDSAR